jgi:hypothetical protein
MIINYPPIHFKFKEENDKQFLFDAIRKKWIIITPEEWVRQNLIQYLIQIKKFPKQLFAIEKLIKVGELSKRFDVVIYKKDMPWMLIECKQPEVNLSHSTLHQILAYNTTIRAEYLCISNGKNTMLWRLENELFFECSEFEEWEIANC